MAAKNVGENEASSFGGQAEPEFDKLAFVLRKHGISGSNEAKARAIFNEMMGNVVGSAGQRVAKKFEEMMKKKKDKAAAKKKLDKEK
ncbi:unnamed protein product [Calypogeia fissa]